MSTTQAKDAIAVNPSCEIGSGGLRIGGSAPLALIAGPCVIESEDMILSHAARLKEIAASTGIGLVFKSSYDKANRTSGGSFRGLGIEKGLEILRRVQRELGLPVVTDVHTIDEARLAGSVVDLIQIPAFLCRQTDLLIAAAETGKPVMVKKGQWMAPSDMRFAAEKIAKAGNRNVLLCERGTAFGYRELIVDMRGLQVMSEIGCPVVFDGTHSVQLMGGAGGKSGGNRQFIPLLVRAAVAVGVNAVFLEAHENPDRAPSDGPNMLPMNEIQTLIEDMLALSRLPLRTRPSGH